MSGYLWEGLWDRLNDFFMVLVGQLRECNSGIWTQISHQETSAFPFTGFLSLGRGNPGDEDLLLEWSVQRSNGCLSITADILRNNEEILSELPPVELAEPVAEDGLANELEKAIRFFRENTELIKQEICR
jgi:hypothetical protein